VLVRVLQLADGHAAGIGYRFHRLVFPRKASGILASEAGKIKQKMGLLLTEWVDEVLFLASREPGVLVILGGSSLGRAGMQGSDTVDCSAAPVPAALPLRTRC
jgi:hypothetical protein